MNQAVVWSKSKDKIDKQDLAYLINQTLMFGNLREVKEMIKKEGKDNIRGIFVNQPLAIYSRSAFKFIKDFVLEINEKLEEKKYVKTLY